MKHLAAGVMVFLACSARLPAQAQDRSFERIALAVQQPSPLVLSAPTIESDLPRRIGPFALVPPALRGEVVRVSVPVGDLVTRAVHAVTVANRRRQELAARRKVAVAVRSFEERKSR
jgi:hypothetical protein